MKHRKRWTAGELFERLRAGDRAALGRAITLVESTRPEDREDAAELIERCLPFSGGGYRIGISGAPGAGKSTFIEAYGQLLTARGQAVAVLAIDPSSGVHHGSILGDKTRMEQLSRDPLAYIRPSPSGTTLGGVARKTRETILLCEAAGYKRILIETVGVGQSETAVQAMSDLYLLLLLPGAGDELQGIKRGIVELADMVLVNKADGERRHLAEEARQQYLQALHLYPARPSGQTVPVFLVSALEELGLETVAEAIDQWLAETEASGHLARQRREQQAFWYRESIADQLQEWVFGTFDGPYREWQTQVLEGRMSPFAAADKLMHLIRGK